MMPEGQRSLAVDSFTLFNEKDFIEDVETRGVTNIYNFKDIITIHSMSTLGADEKMWEFLIIFNTTGLSFTMFERLDRVPPSLNKSIKTINENLPYNFKEFFDCLFNTKGEK